MRTTQLKALLILTFSFISMNIYASLSNHPASYKENVIKGSTKTVELHISNSLSSPLGYSFTITAGWVRATPPTGEVGGNATLTVNLILDATNLAEGVYSTTVTLIDPHHGGLSIPIELSVSSTTDIKEKQSVPTEFMLMQNYPNPFNPSTIISYSIPETQNVSLIVYDLLGKEVAVLVNEVKQPGSYNTQFAIPNFQLSSGIYFYTLKTDRFAQTRKMLLTK